MRNKIFILLCSLLFAACASNQPEQSGPSLKERIKEARKSVNVVMPDSADWCTASKNCTYVADVYCDKATGTKEKGQKKCLNKLRSKTIKLGGDTFIVQSIGMTSGQNEFHDPKLHFRAFGQIYRCSDKNAALSNEFLASKQGPHKLGFQMVTEKYHNQCDANRNCKAVRPINCSSVQDTPLKRCLLKMETKEMSRGMFNYVVFNKDLYNKIGAYRIYTDTFTCN